MKNFFIWGMLYYLRFFARLSLSINKPKIIGITGSVGKSSARNIVYAILKDHFKVKMIKEGNSETGIPLGLLGINPGHYQPTDWFRIMLLSPFKINNLKGVEYLIVEMGIDSPYPPKNMDYLLTIVKPDISVVLNVHLVHTMQFDQTVNKYIKREERLKAITKKISEEKFKIITKNHPKIGIFNESTLFHPTGVTGTKLMTFGESKNNNVYYGGYDVDLEKSRFELIFPYLRSQKITIEIKGYFLPKRYQEVISAGFLVGQSLGLKIEEIKKSLVDNFFLPVGRSSIFKGINDSTIIDSSYNASRAPFLTFIETAGMLAKREKKPFVILMGDMREMGREAETEHKVVAEAIKKTADYFFCVGELTKKYVLPEVSKNVKTSCWFRSSVEMGRYLKTSLPHRSIVLVKGSQNTIFLEETVKFILKNKKDEKNLCRQSDFWAKKKRYLYGV